MKFAFTAVKLRSQLIQSLRVPCARKKYFNLSQTLEEGLTFTILCNDRQPHDVEENTRLDQKHVEEGVQEGKRDPINAQVFRIEYFRIRL